MKTKSKEKKERRERRHSRIKAKTKTGENRPRLSVFKSNRFLHVQIIDDRKEETIAGAVSKDAKGKTPKERSREVGKMVAEKALKKGVKEVVFDRGGFSYKGHVKEVAEGAREAGLKF